MEIKLKKIENSQLEDVVKESGLAIQEGEEIKKSYIPFVAQLNEIQSQSTKINFDHPQPIDETIARELRLKTVKIRTGAEELKNDRKKVYLLRGNLEQAAYNLIAASCKLTEETFNNVEKAREIAEKKRREELKAERIERLSPYDIEPQFYDLANMPENVFDNLLLGAKTALENKITAEKKFEEERLAKIEAERIENERIRKENDRLLKEKEIQKKLIEKRQPELQPYIIFIRDYNELILSDEKKYQKDLSEIKIGAEQHWKFEREKVEKEEKKRKELEEKNRKEMEKQNAILEAAKKEQERLANELRIKQEEEAKVKREEEERKQVDIKAKAEELHRLESASDKEKLTEWIDKLIIGITPNVSGKAYPTAINIQDKFSKFITWAKQQIEEL